MTPQQRAEARARCAIATSGPWFAVDSERTDAWVSVADGRPEFDDDESTFAWMILVDDPEEGYSIVHGENYHSVPQIQRDIDFIAHARADLPAALAEIDRLEVLLRRYGIDPGESRK